MTNRYLSLLYSVSKKPLEYWSKQQSPTGCIRLILDEHFHQNVLQIQDIKESKDQKTSIMCPSDINQLLNIQLPYLVVVVKNMNAEWYFQVQLVDNENIRHVFNFSSVEVKPKARPTSISDVFVSLEQGWNKIELDLHRLTSVAFRSRFKAVQRLKICANCRLRRIYFTDRHIGDYEMPGELYEGFIDLYMLKWGVSKVDRTTQTMSTCRRKMNMLQKETSPNVLKLNFIKNLQNRSDNIITTFSNKQPSISEKQLVNFRNIAKIKPYSVFRCTKKVSSFSKINIDFGNFDEKNSLPTELLDEKQVQETKPTF